MTDLKTSFRMTLFIAILLSVSTPIFSQLCTRNVIDCTGLCGRFTDNNEDGICDFSPRSTPAKAAENVDTKATEATKVAEAAEAKPATKAEATNTNASSTKEKASTISTNIKTKKGSQETAEASSPKTAIADTLASQTTPPNVVDSTKSAAVNPASKPEAHKKKAYPLLEISFLTLGLYLLTYLLVKFNVLKKQTHRKIWNIFLLITFLMSGVLGFFLVVQVNYHILMKSLHLFVELHILFGIAMAIISVIHALWHWNYYKNMFKSKK